MNPKIKTLLYGLAAFFVYIIVLVILRLISGKIPEDATIFGFFASNDIWLGIVVAAVLTFTHERKKRL